MVCADGASAHAVITLMWQVRTQSFQKKTGVLELVRTVLGKMTDAKRDGEHQKNTSLKKKIPHGPQVHTSEVPVH